MNDSQPRRRLARKLSEYCPSQGGLAAALKALAPLAVLAPAAHGAIIYTDVLDTTLQFPIALNPGEATDLFIDFGSAMQPGSISYGFNTSIPLEIDMRFSFNNAADKPYAKGPLTGNGGPAFFANTGIEASGAFGPIGGRYASKLVVDEPVETQNFVRPPNDDSVTYLRTPDTVGSQWAPGDTGFLGVRANISGTMHHGWVEVRVDETSLTVSRFAYEDTVEGPILAGQVPEPHSVLLLAMGASGIAAMRRRRS
jgi:hypothetical protein